MKQKILAIAAMLATTLLANPSAVRLAQANQLLEVPVTKGLATSQNSDNGGGSNQLAVMLLITGGAVAVGSAAIIARILARYKPSSRTAHFQPQGEDKPETIKEGVKVTFKPSDTSLYIERAYAHLKQGDVQKAIEDFNEAIRLNPQSAFLYSERANFRKRNLGDKQGAIEDYNKAIRINPDNALFYMWRSQAHHDLGNEQKAVQDYNEAIRLAPEDTMCYCFQSAVNSRLSS